MPGKAGNRHASREAPSLQKNQARRTPRNAQRAWRVVVRRVQLRLGGRLDSGMILEELLVHVDELLPLIGGLVFCEDRLHRAHRLTGPAVDALVRMDVQHRVTFVDAVHRTHLDTGLVLHVDARLGDDIRHLDLRSRGSFQEFSPWQTIGFCTRIRTMCQAIHAFAPASRAPAILAYWVLSRGSRASRSESPKRLNANTARLMARPGKIAIQGAASANWTAAPRSISPHAAVGSDTPSPRNDSDASSRIAWPR